MTPSAPGTVTLTARAEGGLLWRATHLARASGPQDMAYVTSIPVTATTTLSVGAPLPALSRRWPAPEARAGLRLVKSAPASVVRGRSIPYTLTVTNASARTARNVVVRDPLPGDTVLTGTPARARLSDGVVVWRLGDLAPHARVIVHLRLRTVTGAPRLVRNAARASAANAATVRASAVTRLVAPPRTGRATGRRPSRHRLNFTCRPPRGGSGRKIQGGPHGATVRPVDAASIRDPVRGTAR